MKKIVMTFALAGFIGFSAHAQDDLIASLKDNQSLSATAGFEFTPIINLERTSVKNQGSSGTCWSYSGNSFLESEMIREGKEPVDIAEIYTARCTYIEKAKNYVRMHGNLGWGDGGALHDVINMYDTYGALPQEVYNGLNYGTDINRFGEMQAALKGMLDGVIQNKNRQLTPNWIKAFTAVLDSYLGEVPENFEYKGKTYTPKSFADEVIGLKADNYLELTCIPNEPLYEEVFFPVPDNWSFDYAYNVQMDDLTATIDNALENGYTVGWATDVSEKYFSWKNGVAYVPEMDYKYMTAEEKDNMFNGPQPEAEITPEMRQEAFDNYTTTDDHGMQIVGLAKDQNGKEYYIVKNSWGESNDYMGYLFVTKNFVKYKTTALLVNKKAIPKKIYKS
ncbi:C1 family peptidase [Neptunitalea lumnitzerae]|uniref:Aminopeptidase n=1 Tax=Neptunitalea lumnitzerae TaxID=2965509 RepID=A0ABQ5MK49_9FLAO|nr:C1 family peptidase [Neptunitalea sp. Y10]GLB49774.1 aminopeptidase [Neptunitalea sp. Y10]